MFGRFDFIFVSEILGFLVLGMCFGEQLGLDQFRMWWTICCCHVFCCLAVSILIFLLITPIHVLICLSSCRHTTFESKCYFRLQHLIGENSTFSHFVLKMLMILMHILLYSILVQIIFWTAL